MSTMNSNVALPEDDPRVLMCAANLLSRFASRLLNPPRLPTPNELSVLECLQHDLKKIVAPIDVRHYNNGIYGGDASSCEDQVSLGLLKRLWSAWHGPDVPFERMSARWSDMGFQHPRDPASDFRGGGRLSLQCLVYLFERHGAVARKMVGRREIRGRSRGEFANYPFACAGITMTKRLCEALLVCTPLTGKASDLYTRTPATFWHVAASRTAFLELYVWAFVQLDALWDESHASYLDFGHVVTLVMQRTTNVLHRLPADVVPSARSHPLTTKFDASIQDAVDIEPGAVEQEPAFVLEGFPNSTTENSTDIKELIYEACSNTITSDEIPGMMETDDANLLNTHLQPSPPMGDLLGLSQFDIASEDMLVVRRTTTSPNPAGASSNDFFSEFGLLD